MNALKSSVTSKPRKPAVKATASIQLMVRLSYIAPPIWRRLVVPDTCTLAKLHEIIQITMGWEERHLHSFEVNGIRYTDPELDPENEMGMENERRVRLSDLVRERVDIFGYEYDFGDGWLHQIAIEKVVPGDPVVKYATCLEGARACPPEDCGSFPGHANILKALKAKRKSTEQKELLEWLGDSYDPELFNLIAVNQRLARLKI